MGRRPIGHRAMTSAERQRRFLDRIRARAAAPPAPAPAPKPAFVIADGRSIRIQHCLMFPVETTRWLRQVMGNRATRAIIQGLTQALADPSITSERDE
jgi:hypothetical protein